MAALLTLAVTVTMVAAAPVRADAATAWRGVDVSRWQHPNGAAINWASARADGVRFGYVKATEAANYVNPYLGRDLQGMAANGIMRGSYHYARPRIGNAAKQARFFVRAIGDQHARGVLPPVLDLESTGGLGRRAMRTWTANWLGTVKSLTGRTPMIYTSPSFWQDRLGNSSAFHAYPLWIANYGVSHPIVPGGWPGWTFWQKANTGRVSGIRGQVDIDVFHSTLTQLKTMAGISTSTTSTGGGTTTSGGTTSSGGATTVSGDAVTRRSTHLSGHVAKHDTYRAYTPVTFFGRLSSHTHGLRGRHVTVYGRLVGHRTWYAVARDITGRYGRYHVTVRPGMSAEYVARYHGSATLRPDGSAIRTIRVHH
jgi:GH25 family lysozyme M1 (1,4-beta-N-acetylmuramidase)